jgi:delta(3,5)-delta(2,4)-dienoyl-CoA isomerase
MASSLLDSPPRKLDSGPRTYGALFDRITSEWRGGDVRAAVLTSALSKLFTAGIDRAPFLLSSTIILPFEVWQGTDSAKIMTGGVNGVSSPDGARCSLALLHDIKKFQQAIGAPERCPFPVIISQAGPGPRRRHCECLRHKIHR